MSSRGQEIRIEQRVGLVSRQCVTLTAQELVVERRRLMGSRTEVVDLASIEAILHAEGVGPAPAAVLGMVACLGVMAAAVAAQRMGYPVVPVVAGLGVAAALAIGWTVRVGAAGRYAVRTASGRQVWILDASPSAPAVAAFMGRLQQRIEARAAAQEAPPDPTPAGPEAQEAVRSEIVRLSALVESREISPEEFALRKRMLLDFAARGTPGGADRTIH